VVPHSPPPEPIGASDIPREAGEAGPDFQGGSCEPQQPRQIFLSRAFIAASSALIESTLFGATAFGAVAFGAGAGAARSDGFNAGDEAAAVVLS